VWCSGILERAFSDEHNPHAVVFDQRLGVLARLPSSLAMELL
jgi:hypothetical protein